MLQDPGYPQAASGMTAANDSTGFGMTYGGDRALFEMLGYEVLRKEPCLLLVEPYDVAHEKVVGAVVAGFDCGFCGMAAERKHMPVRFDEPAKLHCGRLAAFRRPA